MKNWNQINQELIEIYNELEENGGEITPEIEEQLKINEEDLINYTENIISTISHNSCDIDERNKLIERHKRQIAIKNNINEYLQQQLIQIVQKFGKLEGKNKNKSLQIEEYKLALKVSKSVKIDENEFQNAPDNLKRFKVIPVNVNPAHVNDLKQYGVSVNIEPNKNLIKELLENNKEVEGCELIENTTVKIS